MAKTGKFKCVACNRTFSMAAHLGRHRSTVHAPAQPSARGVISGGRRRTGRAKAQTGHTLPVGAAQATATLHAYRVQLSAQRAELDAQLAAIDGALAKLDGTAAVATHRVTQRGQRGSTRPGSLKDLIVRALRGRARPMRVRDITAAVRQAGYATASRRLERRVSNALTAMPQAVKVARGEYRLRG